jgi:uncharacterized phiE125 gp8 family phage protein
MALYLVSPVSAEPLTIEDAKAHCRVDVDDDDALFETLIVAAREYCETFTHRALAPQTWDYKFNMFPTGWYAPIVLPMPPVTAITSITYTDINNVSQTWASTNYTTDLPSGPWAAPARIVPNYGVIYPVTLLVINAVTVRFTAGYSSTPEAIKHAMKLLIAHWYKNREGVVTDLRAESLPHAIDSLLWPFKSFDGC